jgi:hypothetical protein
MGADNRNNHLDVLAVWMYHPAFGNYRSIQLERNND